MVPMREKLSDFILNIPTIHVLESNSDRNFSCDLSVSPQSVGSFTDEGISIPAKGLNLTPPILQINEKNFIHTGRHTPSAPAASFIGKYQEVLTKSFVRKIAFGLLKRVNLEPELPPSADRVTFLRAA